jgi:hypothetical protein
MYLVVRNPESGSARGGKEGVLKKSEDKRGPGYNKGKPDMQPSLIQQSSPHDPASPAGCLPSFHHSPVSEPRNVEAVEHGWLIGLWLKRRRCPVKLTRWRWLIY